ncbi:MULTISPECIES: GNAT family N-acetyltransferase [unclassified Rhizobium]|uniref:GNAT family N-acetyltransferase n=1 Tax=unclassified Rhizobium TaxID=2613769 RepID=UPI000BA882F0|nr:MULTISPECIES: GNAT family N-acetyltransferase [unclassified Rhizobium]ASW10281.1 GNAT family N-acetyltransferase [Rhizobium sp. 11515TR]MDK4716509.1 GNAT family N-acetyltransferase [Rhizobium sp. CNPSo 4039]
MPPKIDDYFIRPATEDDVDALFHICLVTADAGADASALYSNPRLPGYVWAVPYLKFAPEFAFVLARHDRVVGYVVGTPDTASFDKALGRDWWPPVRREIADLIPSTEKDADVLERIANPHSGTPGLEETYPAHLHINILPEAQSGGWGRLMIETMLDKLSSHGVPAVHLGVSPANERAKGFYRHLGFEELRHGDHLAFVMRLDKPAI